ncbi:class I SAM-dependent methyltransferase [Pseudomaricurvus sp. HS19]|uniref:class I SAM-dependent methyltransferase n=1 Tax=Pseudomaricurvus sp. HS19 TaxID=2692626 RepID=UPI0013698C47|nr:methyltransferase domain-containing protein [Pseudomaricurvus sp. HS19]
METVNREQVTAGQAVYSKFTLAIYDALVLGFSCRWLWRCDASLMLEQYDHLASDNHLDVGVGSGYFPDRCYFSSLKPRIALMDLNESSLAYTAKRIARFEPETYQRNVLEDMSVEGQPGFDSVGLNFLLHCVPGSMEYKAAIFRNCLTVMNPGAVLFGATILGQGVEPNRGARKLMAFYNRKGVFSNQQDSAAALEAQLKKYFCNVKVTVEGCVALFSAEKARA